MVQNPSINAAVIMDLAPGAMVIVCASLTKHYCVLKIKKKNSKKETNYDYGIRRNEDSLICHYHIIFLLWRWHKLVRLVQKMMMDLNNMIVTVVKFFTAVILLINIILIYWAYRMGAFKSEEK